MSVQDVLNRNGPRKLLALDGGGIRGLITLRILSKIEATLAKGRPNFVLADYFDYVAGTSTGAIIAACVSLGMNVKDIVEFYEGSGKDMFEPASVFQRLHAKYGDDALSSKLQEVLDRGMPRGQHRTLGDNALRTLLMMVLKNTSTDSHWPLSNNPNAKYNARTRPDCNLDLPLWQLVRGSTAAPIYFPPEVISIGGKPIEFVDGGMTMYNNPAFQLFVMATAEPYKLQWPTGKEKMLIVSVGTGNAASPKAAAGTSWFAAIHSSIVSTMPPVLASLPGTLMYGASVEQDVLRRVLGDCRFGAEIDREVGTYIGAAGPAVPKLFTYMRYNPELSRRGLDELGLKNIDPGKVQKLDSIEFMDDLSRVGTAYAEASVKPEHFKGFES